MNNKSHLLQIEKRHFLYITLILYFIFFHKIAQSQTTFNKEIWPMKFINAPGIILTKGDTIICLGYGTDYYSFTYYDAFVAWYDLEGNYIKRNIDTFGNYYYQDINKAFYLDSIIVAAVTSFDFFNIRDKGYVGGYLLIIDQETGEFIKKIKITKEQDQSRIGIIKDLTQIDSVTFAVVSTIDEKIYTRKNDTQICIVNIKTGALRYIELGKENFDDIPEGITWDGKKLLIGTWKKEKEWNEQGTQKIEVPYGIIYGVDTVGTWGEIYESDSSRGSIRDLIINDDNEYISTILSITDFNYKNESVFRWRHHVLKLDSNFNKIWEKPWGLGYDFNFEFGFSGILEAEEGDGYILSGYEPNFSYSIKGYGIWKEQIDSLHEKNTIPMTVGILQKINEEGDSIWLRSYSYVNDKSLNFVYHWLKSINHSPDNGYILFGEILHGPRPNIDTANQYPGWLLKVDKYGCLVPGCQDTTDTTSIVDILPDTGIMLYPNPVSDRLYIYQSKSGDTHYTITDTSGRTIQKWSGNLPNHTYILDVSRYKPGVYILTVEREGERRAEKFVVER